VQGQMSCDLHALCFDADEPRRLALFWAGVLGREMTDDHDDGVALLPSGEPGFRIRFQRTEQPRRGPNQIHLDLTSSSLDDMQGTVARVLDLGGTHLDVGQRPDEGHVVLADPEGNELCVIPPNNGFLSDTAFIGAINCDGSQQVGYFWSKALDWPLVWDQDEETAIQSPRGGSKMAWGGQPVRPKSGNNRIHLDLAPPVDGDQQAEVERLTSLGATRLDIGQGNVGWVVMADPDGNEFCVLTPR
jgi:predicted enzyme related to lactoylglutathione lyase